jgi:butyryl-CoA dehydrogenase
MARALQASLDKLLRTTAAAWVDGDPELATANATPYLQGFGHVVVAWLWLEMAIAATRSAGQATEEHGKMRAARYFFQYELPKVDAWLRVVADRDRTCLEAAETCFLQ